MKVRKLRVSPEESFKITVLYLSLLFGNNSVLNVIEKFKRGDKSLSVREKERKKDVLAFINFSKRNSFDEIKKRFFNLDPELKELVVYSILKKALLNSLSYTDFKIDDLKNFVFGD